MPWLPLSMPPARAPPLQHATQASEGGTEDAASTRDGQDHQNPGPGEGQDTANECDPSLPTRRTLGSVEPGGPHRSLLRRLSHFRLLSADITRAGRAGGQMRGGASGHNSGYIAYEIR
ncbi:unnamed protein product [Arctogadus glacialis]